ncbi:MAG: protein-tyrosine phosphatase family protein [Ilumatobacteraceae bacterium]
MTNDNNSDDNSDDNSGDTSDGDLIDAGSRRHGWRAPRRPASAELSMIAPRLIVSGELPGGWEEADAELRRWVESGVTDIVDVRIEADDRSVVAMLQPGLRYHRFPVQDDGRERSDGWFDAGTSAVLEALDDPARCVLVHCAIGVNRSASLAYAVMLASGRDAIEALDDIRRSRPIAVVLYAEDAVRWWHRRLGSDTAVVRREVERVHDWFARNVGQASWIIGRLDPVDPDC